MIDSELQYHRILKSICAKYGKEYTQELESRIARLFYEYYNNISRMQAKAVKNTGGTDMEICTTVVRELQLNISPEELERELASMTQNTLPKAPLRKGVERLLNHLCHSGVLFGLATNSSRRDVRLHVASKPKIFRLFHHMVCAGDPDVDRGKPYPDIYLMAASKFPDKPLPVKCLVFEDSLVGLEAGLAAGMQVVMTPPRNLPVQSCKAATLVLKSLQDFKPEQFGLPPFLPSSATKIDNK